MHETNVKFAQNLKQWQCLYRHVFISYIYWLVYSPSVLPVSLFMFTQTHQLPYVDGTWYMLPPQLFFLSFKSIYLYISMQLFLCNLLLFCDILCLYHYKIVQSAILVVHTLHCYTCCFCTDYLSSLRRNVFFASNLSCFLFYQFKVDYFSMVVVIKISAECI